MNEKCPFYIFLAITIIFFAGQFTINLISLHYNFVHFIFGFGAPFLAGYFPYRLFKLQGINKLPFNKEFTWCWHWSIWPAVIVVSAVSHVNEIIDDPIKNGEPFYDAWHHYAIDHFGIAVFVIFYLAILKKNAKNA